MRLNDATRANGVANQRLTLDNERVFANSLGLFVDKFAQSLNPIARECEWRQNQTRAPFAVSTSFAKAFLSLTARSARILRSTTTPAFDKPSMNRL